MLKDAKSSCFRVERSCQTLLQMDLDARFRLIITIFDFESHRVDLVSISLSLA